MLKNTIKSLDSRSQHLLKTLVECYIIEGQPVGSRTLSRHSGLELSPATVRNVMSDLEEMGLISSPHASAGRIPTSQGYRFFIDSLLTVQPMEAAKLRALQGQLQADQPQQLISTASHLLSDLTHFAGVVVVSQRQPMLIHQVEFVSLSDTRILLIIVTTSGDVQNRILTTRRKYSASELVEAANYLTAHFAGCSFDDMRSRLNVELAKLHSDMTELMQAAMHVSNDEEKDRYVLSGETNLLDIEDFSSNMTRVRDLFRLFEQKKDLMQLLELSSRANGVQIFIGGESGLPELDGCSIITAGYEHNGKLVGSVGVIGPTRMAYDQVIPIVDITARLLSNALSGNP